MSIVEMAKRNSNYNFVDCQGVTAKFPRLFLKLILITLCCSGFINRVFNKGEYLQ